MYEQLKKRVLDSNIRLHALGLAPFTWGNVSELDRENGVFAIKPSGVAYDELTADKIVIVRLDGTVLPGQLSPSSDTPTHLCLYNSLPECGGIVHMHSLYATSWAQAGKDIPPYGTTHADFSHTPVPCTRPLDDAEINGEYELNTGRVICECMKERGYDISGTPAVLVNGHGPFIFGHNAEKAVDNAAVLEIVAQCAVLTERIGGASPAGISQTLLDRHYYRKHGKNAYYGQR